jgi:hypothetical protein
MDFQCNLSLLFHQSLPEEMKDRKQTIAFFQLLQWDKQWAIYLLRHGLRFNRPTRHLILK